MGLIAAAGCRRKHIKVVTLSIPEMQSDACAALVLRAVQGVAGVIRDDIDVNVSQRTVTVPYDSLQLARKNIQFAVADTGFRVVETLELADRTITNTIPANEQAREKLPMACRP